MMMAFSYLATEKYIVIKLTILHAFIIMCNLLKEHRSENFLTELIEIALLINSNSVIS